MNSTAISDDIIAAGMPWSAIVGKGQYLTIIDLEGQQGVDFLCYNAKRPEERYHAPNTLKASRDLRLSKGHKLYSDEARVIFTLVEDSCAGHDTIGGCCSAPSNEMLYAVADCPGCRENFLAALAEHGLGRKDIVPNINFFCNVPVDENRKLAPTVFLPGYSKPGDHVSLRAEMDALAVISNCPQMNNPCNSGQPTAIRVIVSKNIPVL
ncbi:MAG: urea carboxylase-associated protein 1 [Gammaproteobacteria bacterium]|jgi:urea carboxylase-associated protein 1